MGGILYTIVAVLVVLWIIGFLFAHIASPLIHLVLVVAICLFAFQVITGRRTV